MKKRKLRGFVLPTLYLMIIATIFVGVNYLGKALGNNSYDSYNFVMSAFKNKVISVGKEENNIIVKPFVSDDVKVAKDYYDMNSDEKTQQNSLIYYENTYMENTGILYSSSEKFDVVAVMDGTIKDIKEDEILGVVVEVENTSKVTTIYYSLGELNVSVGDQIKQGETIGTSGNNKLGADSENVLLFEVYLEGNLINPNDFYNMKINDLK